MAAKAKNVHEYIIEINGDEWKKIIDNTFKKVVKTVKVDGFRPGKVPRDVYEKKFGKQALIVEAVDEAVKDAYKKALDEFKGVAIMQPQVAIEKADEEGVAYKFIFTTRPEVKIKKYSSLGVQKDTVKVTDKDVEEEIKKIQKEYADLQVKEGKIESGDVAVIDFEGFDNGVAFDGGKGENYSLEIGSNTFIPGFEDALIGLKAGDEKDVNVSFPEDYMAEDLKGKPVVFKVKVNEVKTKVLPELNEDFFLDLGFDDVKTVEDLKKTIKKGMTEQKEYQAENKYVDELFEALLKQITVEIPHEVIHEEMDTMIKEYEDRLKMQGLTLKQFYEFTKTSEEDLKAQMHSEAEKRITIRFALEEIIEKENIEATDEEADKEAIEKSEKHNISKEEYINAFGGIEMIKYDVKIAKVLEILKK